MIVGESSGRGTLGTAYYTDEPSRTCASGSRGRLLRQWLSGQLSVPELRTIAATFSDVFEDAELWLNRTQPSRPLLGLVAFRGRPAGKPRPQRIGEMIRICGAPVLRAWSASAPRNTDDFPRIEFSAASSHLVRTVADAQAVLAAVRRLRVEEAAASGRQPARTGRSAQQAAGERSSTGLR